MRSLRRSRHQRLPSGSTSTATFHAEELRTIKRRERIGMLRIITWSGFLLGVAALLAWSAYGRIVAQGMVETNLVEVRAPGRVRVKEVRLQPGQSFRRGEPLFVLEGLETQSERRALELDLDRAKLRLTLAEAGGDLGEVDIDRRLAGVEDAEREWRLAEAALDVAGAELVVLQRRRETLLATSESVVFGFDSQAQTLEERLLEVEALVESADVAQRLAQFDVETRTALERLGASSERERLVAEASREQSAVEKQGYLATGRSLEQQAGRMRQAGLLEQQRVLTELAELEATLDGAEEGIEALRVRRDQWRSTTLRRRVLSANGPDSVARLRELELDLLRKDVEAAEARLFGFDRRSGNGTVRAEADGVCDQLLVSTGTVVARGELMATHYDPADRRVVAYVEPGAAEELALGQGVSVTPLRGDESTWGRVASSAAVWVPRPAAIPGREEPSADRRLAFQLALTNLPEHYRPGMRVTVVFDREPDAPDKDPSAFDRLLERAGFAIGGSAFKENE